MTIRTSNKTVTFKRPFVLDGFDEAMPQDASGEDKDEPDASLTPREQGPVKISAGRDASQESLKMTTEVLRKEADRRAIERGEDEGMPARPE